MNALAQRRLSGVNGVLNRVLLALALLLGVSLGACDGVHKQPGLLEMIAGEPEISLRVMSFNIRYANPGDGDNRWENRRALAAQTIRAQSPDIVGLQEALSDQLQDLLAELPEYEAVGVGRDDGREEGEYAAILYKRERLSLQAAKTFWFSPTPQKPGSKGWGATLPRICTTASFSVVGSGRAVRVFNVHLDHQSERSREESAHLLARAIFDTRQFNVPVIVTGDFNTGESSGVISYLTGRTDRAGSEASDSGVPGSPRLIDTFRVRSTQTEGTGTYHAWTGDTGGERIDFILVDRSLQVQDAGIDYTKAAAGQDGQPTALPGGYPSDHFPIFTTVSIPGRAN